MPPARAPGRSHCLSIFLDDVCDVLGLRRPSLPQIGCCMMPLPPPLMVILRGMLAAARPPSGGSTAHHSHREAWRDMISGHTIVVPRSRLMLDVHLHGVRSAL